MHFPLSVMVLASSSAVVVGVIVMTPIAIVSKKSLTTRDDIAFLLEIIIGSGSVCGLVLVVGAAVLQLPAVVVGAIGKASEEKNADELGLWN